MADLTIRISDRMLKTAVTVLMVVLASWGVSHLWASGVLLPKYQIQMFLPNESGLRAGALVTLNGMRVGNVSRVEFAKGATDSDRSIKVTLNIQNSVRDFIRGDSKATLIPRGLLGEHYVDIQRGFGGPPVEAGGEIGVVPTKQVSLTDVLNVLTQKRGCGSEEKNSAENMSQATPAKNRTTQ